jgi:uncharacterized protein DUF5819
VNDMSSTVRQSSRDGIVPASGGAVPPQMSATAPLPRTSQTCIGGDETSPGVRLSRPVELAVVAAVALCLTAAVVHVAMVFLYVAPPNTVSRLYQKQIDAWVYPYFEQDWRLFAPDPQSARQQISARTSTVTPGGATRLSGWIDLTAVDDAAVRHDVFPSHTAQNMLRRAWAAYASVQDANGTGQPPSQRARILQEYLRNIAVQRAAAANQGAFSAIQLRVVTTPIAPPSLQAVPNRPAASPSSVRYLPWWQVTTHDV